MSSIANMVNSQAVGSSFYTHVGFLIDNSGSMDPYTHSVNEGVKEFLSNIYSLAASRRKGDLVLSEFSNFYSPVLNKDFSLISKSTKYNFKANSYTCLYDSIQKIISDVEKNVKKVANNKSKVIIPILTDGQDSGCTLTANQIEQIIESKKKEGWQFVFLGSDSSTKEIAGKIGINPDLAITFDQNRIKEAIDFVGKKLNQVSRGRELRVTQDERFLLEGSSSRTRGDL